MHVAMPLEGEGPAVFVLSMVFAAGPVSADTAERLTPSECNFTYIAGYDNLCLFNRFAHGTSLLAPTLRKQVCGFMNVDRRSGMHGTNRTVAEFVLEDGSSVQSLSVNTLRREAAGLPVDDAERPSTPTAEGGIRPDLGHDCGTRHTAAHASL